MFSIEEVDQDGAIRETADAVQGDTRMSFLKKAGVGAGALMGGGAVLAALAPEAMAAGRPPSSFGKGDFGILNFALTLEYLERAFYNEAKKNGIAKGDKELSGILDTNVIDEDAHVKFIYTAIKKAGGKPVKQPKFGFGKAVTDKKTFVETSFALENTGVHAYLGQAGNIKTPAYLLAAASIVTVEARHSGAIAVYIGASPSSITPSGAFDKGWSADKVLKAVKKTGFIKK